MKPKQIDASRQPGLHVGCAAVCVAAAAAFVHAHAQPSAFVPAQAVAPSAAPDTLPSPTKPPTTSLSTDDLRFFDEAIMASDMEVAASELALKVSNDPKIIAYARRMLKDHSAAADALRKLARDKGVTPQKRVPEAPELA